MERESPDETLRMRGMNRCILRMLKYTFSAQLCVRNIRVSTNLTCFKHPILLFFLSIKMQNKKVKHRSLNKIPVFLIQLQARPCSCLEKTKNKKKSFFYPLRKRVYSNILKILPPKNKIIQIKILIFFIFLLRISRCISESPLGIR